MDALQKKTMQTVFVVLALLVLIAMANQWFASQLSEVEVLVEKKQVEPQNTMTAHQVMKEARKTLKPPVIDPLNDPLAPRVKVTSVPADPEKVFEKQSVDKKTLEAPLDSPLLIQ